LFLIARLVTEILSWINNWS